jgi:hypothetical protein
MAVGLSWRGELRARKAGLLCVIARVSSDPRAHLLI